MSPFIECVLFQSRVFLSVLTAKSLDNEIIAGALQKGFLRDIHVTGFTSICSAKSSSACLEICSGWETEFYLTVVYQDLGVLSLSTNSMSVFIYSITLVLNFYSFPQGPLTHLSTKQLGSHVKETFV